MTQENKAISNRYTPPVSLRRFVQVLLSQDVMGNKTQAEKLSGVDKGKFYYHWNKSPEFRAWYALQCDEFLKKNEATVASKLMEQIRAGDVSAMKLYHQLTGKLKDGVITAVQVQNINNANEKHGEDLTTEELRAIKRLGDRLENEHCKDCIHFIGVMSH